MWIKKYKLLVWKNWIQVKRHPIATFFELILPIIIILFYVIERNDKNIKNVKLKQSTEFWFYRSRCEFNYETIQNFGFAPNNEFYRNLMETVVDEFRSDMGEHESRDSINKNYTLYAFENITALLLWTKNQGSSDPVFGVAFEDSSQIPPKHLNYTIHIQTYGYRHEKNYGWLTDKLYYITIKPGLRHVHEYIYKNGYIPDTPSYYSTCFVRLQNEIDQAFIKSLNKNKSSNKVEYLRTFPYPDTIADRFSDEMGTFFAFYFVIFMMLSAKILIKNILLDRESRILESMKIMGLSTLQYWSSWLTRTFATLIIPFTINVIIMTTRILTHVAMLPNSNILIIWLFFTSYIVSLTTFCFLVSVVLKKPSQAFTYGTPIFIGAIMPYTFFGSDFAYLSYATKILFSLLTNTNFGLGMKMILFTETNDNGCRFGNLFKRDEDVNFAFGEFLIFMNIGSSLWMVLTLYIERVFPGDFGIPQPWYFPIQRFFKSPEKKSNVYDKSDASEADHPLCQPCDREEEPTNLKIGIEIKNLSKKFGSKFAVKNLSLNLYEDQITVLLGHNGAGKTTAMSTLTGLFSPTSGTALVNGYDIRKDLNKARQSLGICQQYDVLFDDLTVAEHLEFYCKLKGMEDEKEIIQEVKKYTSVLGISKKKNKLSSTLSGGQKRRLSVGIALCGKSKFIVMDEATSGMDPSSRRDLWNLLKAEKKGRTILISTHFMDEADTIGDRVAILTDGQLRTVGSSFFLKKRFGTGYRITCVKQDGFDAHAVLDLLEEHAPEAYIESEGKTEAIFVLSKDRLPYFEEIFKNLEEVSEELSIASFGCCYSSLEDVFLKLGYGTFDDPMSSATESQAIEVEGAKIYEKDEESSMTCYQIYAIILKKYWLFCRMWKIFLFYALLSALMIYFLPILVKFSPSDLPRLQISLDVYAESETFYEVEDSRNSSLWKSYAGLFSGKDEVSLVSENLEEFLLTKAKESFRTYNRKNLIAASFSNNKTVGWFNVQPYHTMPLTINMINRAIIKSVAGDDHDISVAIDPYVPEISDERKSRKDFMEHLMGDAITIWYLLFTWPMIYIRNCIKEREMRFKFMQYICGTSRLVYWLTSYIFDYLLFIMLCAIFFGSFVLLNHNHERLYDDFEALMVIGISFGFSWIPFIYGFSFFFNKPSTGELMLEMVFIFSQIIYGLKYLLNGVQGLSGLLDILPLTFFGSFFPPAFLIDAIFWYCQGLFGLQNTTNEQQEEGDFLGKEFSIFRYSDIKFFLLTNFGIGCLYFSLILLKDYSIFAIFYYKYINDSDYSFSTNQFTHDEDVQIESKCVSAMSTEDIKASNLVLKNLTKTYNKATAVNQLSLNLKKHECFGLLGVNGAGKTTTFKMMTGDELIKSGDVWIKGKNLKSELISAHKFIGYCPQYDNCMPELTGRETLKIFALIRGIKMDEIKEMINDIASELEFKKYLDIRISDYSGGTKRKLSTALALLGNPELIFLDECTTGVDPQARRQIWNAIRKIRDNHRLSSSIVLTSHSMDECEALCTRIGIMVNGQFQCIGPVQHLKNKFSKGFILTLKTGLSDANKLEDLKLKILKVFKNAELKENYLDIMTFYLKNMEMKYSKIFKILSEIKGKFDVNDYTLTQMSLEHVFLNISHKKE